MKESFHEIFNTNPRYSTSVGFILGLLLIDNLTAPEQNMLGNWIILIGQTILTNAASQNIIESRISGNLININSKEAKCIYNPPIYNIEKIKEIIKDLYPNSENDINILNKMVNNLQEEINKLKKSN